MNGTVSVPPLEGGVTKRFIFYYINLQNLQQMAILEWNYLVRMRVKLTCGTIV